MRRGRQRGLMRPILGVLNELEKILLAGRGFDSGHRIQIALEGRGRVGRIFRCHGAVN